MPREIVHWNVLEESRKILREKGQKRVADILDHFLPHAYLGAMVPDAPYYHRFGGSPFESVAETLHGTFGNDTFDPIRRATSHLCIQSVDSHALGLWSVLLGTVSHFACDIIFHPLVYYFTGDYYHPDSRERREARIRHRIFEVYLDYYFLQRRTLINDGLMFKTRKGIASTLIDIENFLAIAFAPNLVPEVAAQYWRESFSLMSRCQRLQVSTFAGCVVRQLNRLSFGKLAPFEALVSYGRERTPALFQTALDYKNPISGEGTVATLGEEFEQACEKTVELLSLFEPIIEGWSLGENPADLLANVQGLSLNFGRYKVKPEDARFYSAQFPNLDSGSFGRSSSSR